MRREKVLKDVYALLVVLAFFILYGLIGAEDYRMEQQGNSIRAWSVAQWEAAGEDR